MNTQATETVTTEVVAVTPKVTKKSVADAIFKAKFEERKQSLYANNKDFRKAVITEIMATLNVSVGSAATMYNAQKKVFEAAGEVDEVKLGRDPKKEKPVSAGKRGRPAGSHNKPKTVEPVTEQAQPEVTTTTTTAPVEAQEPALA